MSTATAKIPDNEIPDKELPDFSERRWQAVLDRAPLPDDPFVYAVRTTGIYCLPTCGSRRPNKPNVAFFATAEEAALAGFRACKRCRPDFQRNRQGDRRGDRARSDAIARACRRLETEEPEPSLPSLAAQAGLGPAAFRRLFRTHIGLSPKQYAKAARARRLAAALKTHPTVTGAIYEAGYGASSRGYEALEQRLGMAPSRYRHGAPGEVIRYAIARSVLGPILVAGTARGLCAVEFGDSKASLTDRLTQLFPHADRLPADAEFTGWLDTLLAFIDTPSAGMDLPLDIQGTAFQRRVWDALLTIPAGTTISYTELAKRIGAPGSARAVARACATNGIAVAVPCHRVVRQDGNLAGYRWGIERKRKLLARENKARRER